MMSLRDVQGQFIENWVFKNKKVRNDDTIFSQSFAAAIRRNRYAYSDGYTQADKQKIRKYLESVRDAYSVNGGKIMTAEDMYSHIEYIVNNYHVNVGFAQKILSVFLKIYWCRGDITMPPLCPIDRKILDKLKVKENGQTISWTKFSSIDEYKRCINVARLAAQAAELSIAEWELRTWDGDK